MPNFFNTPCMRAESERFSAHAPYCAVLYLTDKHLSDALSATSTASSLYRESITNTSSIWLALSYIRSTEKMGKSKFQTRRFLSLKERIEVIRLAENYRDTKGLARQFDCGRTQILSILRQKERFLREWADNGDPNQLRGRPSAFAVAINKVVAEWIHRCRCAQLSISDKMIMEKAYHAKKFFKYKKFCPNRRWLNRFKRRFSLDDIDLETPDPTFGAGIERSLKLTDIFEDLKETLDMTIIDTMYHQSSNEQKVFSVTEVNCDTTSPQGSIYDQHIGSNNGTSENEGDDELSWLLDSFCETEMTEEPVYPIKNDEEALECIKKLEEYSMLKDNYRAIGLLTQLEKLYKGQLEA